ncbi:MAG: glycosyltransferase family 2 protein [Nocardioidaceae bacterium]
MVLAMFCWTALLFVRALRWKKRPPPAAPDVADRFLWVFVVPALNEEVTIADSVARLAHVPVAEKLILVVDDGSGDRTPQILRELHQADLVVLRRDPPHARRGKAAALNHAYRALDELRGKVDRDRVIVCIVDADGRLDPEAPRYAAAHFAEPQVAGVQSLVQIYNRLRLLTWMQDVEFAVYGHLFQAGRNGWGTAGMGGNGQFNRLSGLDAIVVDEGPWRDRLTEDQDLGLRLIAAGFDGRQELRGAVDQQGLSNLRALLRQRTRWSQGNLQAIGLAGAVLRRGIVPLLPRLELLAYLLMPFWQGIVGVALVAAIYLWVSGEAVFWDGELVLQLLLFYVLGFGGTVLGVVASRSDEGPRGWAVGFLIGHAYSLYTWLIWPVLLRSAARQLGARRAWAKTEREPLAPTEPHALPAAIPAESSPAARRTPARAPPA